MSQVPPPPLVKHVPTCLHFYRIQVQVQHTHCSSIRIEFCQLGSYACMCSLSCVVFDVISFKTRIPSKCIYSQGAGRVACYQGYLVLVLAGESAVSLYNRTHPPTHVNFLEVDCVRYYSEYVRKYVFMLYDLSPPVSSTTACQR